MGLVSFLLLSSSAAFAVKIKDADCADVNSFNRSVIPQYLAVLDGYNESGKNSVDEIDFEGISSDTRSVVTQCASKKTAKIKDLTSGTGRAKTIYSNSTNINPLKANCSEFISLRKEIQPIAVFWIAGREKPDAIRNGQVNVEFLTRPIMPLIENCKAHPTASFYDETKSWLKQNL